MSPGIGEERRPGQESAPTTGNTTTVSLPQATADAPQTLDDVLDRVDANTDDWWRDCCDRGIAEMASKGVVFSAFDLIDLGVPEPDHPNRWGARLRIAAQRGVIIHAGYGSSRRPSRRQSVVSYWRGAGEARRDGRRG